MPSSSSRVGRERMGRSDDGIIETLAPARPDAARIDLLLQFILAVAAEQDDFRDRELGPIHLLKYVYLADVAHAARRNGETFTGVAWRFHHFGPWAGEVMDRIEPALKVIGAEVKRLASQSGDDFTRYRLASRSDAERVRELAGRDLPPPVQFAVARAVQEFGQDTATLLHSVYRTGPMVSAAPEETLDFNMLVRETAPGYAPDARLSEASEGRKARTRRINAIRAEVQARLAGTPATRGEVAIPRYDDVFAAGVEWLDRLAGEPVPETEGKLAIGAGVWKSDTRRESTIP
jgi:hypothetical protein